MNCIVTQNLCFSYPGKIEVFRNLDLSVACGEKAGVIGSNGSGKSTLFLLLAGLLAPSAGDIALWGKNMRTMDDFKAMRTKIGFLFQDPEDQLFCPTVEEDIAFALLNREVSRKEAQEKVERISDVLEIGHLAKRIPFHLSWGQKKLVALAGVLVMETELMILDEPTDGLDRKAGERIIDHLKSFDCTVLVSSHDPGFLDGICDSRYSLKNKRLDEC